MFKTVLYEIFIRTLSMTFILFYKLEPTTEGYFEEFQNIPLKKFGKIVWGCGSVYLKLSR